jgi:hypothetical protein
MVVRAEAVDTESRIIFSDLLRLDLSQCSNRVEAGIFGQGQRNSLEGVSKATEGILLDGLDLER